MDVGRLKEANIKLIPSQPMTNTILILYCISSNGASLPFRCTWRRFNQKRNHIQQIKSANESSYRCSPLDYECVIEVTVTYQQQNNHFTKVVQSNTVKASHQLRQQRNLIKQPVSAYLKFDKISIQIKIILQDAYLQIITLRQGQNLAFLIPLIQCSPQIDSNPTTFKLNINSKVQNFMNFIEHISGYRIMTSTVVVGFGTQIHRDLVLFGIAQFFLKSSSFSQKFINVNRNQKVDLNKFKNIDSYENSIKNRSQISYSPTASYRQKGKLGENNQLKKSFTNLQAYPKYQEAFKIGSPQPKAPSKIINNDKNRQYLNVFQDDELQLLTTNTTPMTPIDNKKNKHIVTLPSDTPAINLRGSFQQLQRSFNSNLNDDAIDRVFGIQTPNNNQKKLNEQIQKLKKQNDQLKKQVQNFSLLLKQNQTIKKKYHELKEQICKLQQQRTTILADKLRCEVNWHKQQQQKQLLKKQLQSTRGTHTFQRYKTMSYHEATRLKQKQQRHQRQVNHSPNSIYHYK